MKNLAIMAATAVAVIGTMAGGMMTTEAEAKVSGINGQGTNIMSYETSYENDWNSRHSSGKHISGSGYYDDEYYDDYYDDDYDDYYDYDFEDNDCIKYGGNYYYNDGDNYYTYYKGNLVCP